MKLTNFTQPRLWRKEDQEKEIDCLGILPTGSYIVVKNPGTESDGVLYVTSNNPADVEILTRKRMNELFPGEV